MRTLIVHDAELDGRRIDLTVVDAVIATIEPVGVRSPSDAEVIDAKGGAVLPGLHDHHLHLLAMAAAERSVDAGPPTVTNPTELAAALHAAHFALPPGEWIRAVGYHESVAGDLDRAWLDALGIDRPIRVQHRTGALWVLNGAALATLGDATPDGRIFRGDGWLRERLPRRPPDLAATGRRLASFGITGVTDLTPTTDPAELTLLGDAVRSGALRLKVLVTGDAGLDPTIEPDLPRGPVKVVIDDHELPPFDQVVAELRRARATGRTIAVHSVTRESLVLATEAWHEVGTLPGDRIEHGAVIPVELLADVHDLGVTVVTQPSFVHERGDHYLADVDRHDVPHLWRCGSLIEAGIGVAFGSDAPYGNADPWAAIAAAVGRRTRSGAVLGDGERIDPAVALRASLGEPLSPTIPRQLTVGAVADLCLLDRSLAEQLRAPSADAVALTVTSGVVTFAR